MHIGTNGKVRFNISDIENVRNMTRFCMRVATQFKGAPLKATSEDVIAKLECLEVAMVKHNESGKADKPKLRQRIVRRLKKLRAKIQGILDDKEDWNALHTEEVPFDTAWDRVMLQYIDGKLDAWERNDLDAMNYWHRQMLKACDKLERNTGT